MTAMRKLSRATLVVFTVTLFSTSLKAQPKIENYQGGEVSAQEVLLKFRHPAPVAVSQAQRDLDADKIHVVGGPGGAYAFHSRSKNVAAMLNVLSKRGDLIYAEPNYIVRGAATPNDPSFTQLWGLKNTGQTVSGAAGTPGADIHATSAWDMSTSSTNTVIAVLDSGIEYTHPDISANVWSAPAAFGVNIGGAIVTCGAGTHGFNVLTSACDPMDDNGHGTHVSGIIGAVGNNGVGVTGVNWTARMMGVKFLDSTFTGTVAGAINAVEFAIQANAAFANSATPINVRVLNMSWGGLGFSQAFADEINKANANNMLLVAAAGNRNLDNDVNPYYPSSYNVPNIVAVASTDSNDNRTSWSDYGASTVHLAAPGENIYSTMLGGGYMFLNGTSMSAAYVSGAAQLVLSKCSLDTAGLKNDLLNNVDALAAWSGLTTTAGRLNVDKAIRACGAGGFTISASPSSRLVAAGSSTTYDVTVTAAGGFAGTVILSAGGLPQNAAASFSPSSINGSGSSTLTISVPTGASGPFTVTITGASGSVSDSTTASLFVDAGPPSVVSVSPSSGNGTSQTFNFAVSDPDGSGDIAGIHVLINSSVSGTNACWMYYNQASNALWLANNDTSNWNQIVLGSAGTVQNSQCSVNGGAASVTNSGNTLTLTLPITFTSTFSGTQTIYVDATDNAGLDTGYRTMGTWTVGAGGGTPDFTISATPGSQTVAAGSSAQYAVTIAPINNFGGAVTLTAAGLPSGATAAFNPASISGSGSTTLTLNTSSTTSPGSYTISITGASGTLSHSASVTLTVNTAGPPAVSVNPSSGSGMSQTFNFVASDVSGANAVSGINILFNSYFGGTNACWMYYDHPSNTLWMASDDASNWSAVSLGSSGSLQNSQCSVNGGAVSVTVSGNNLTLTIPIVFTSAFTGTRTVFLRALDNAGLDSGYQAKGTWVVQ